MFPKTATVKHLCSSMHASWSATSGWTRSRGLAPGERVWAGVRATVSRKEEFGVRRVEFMRLRRLRARIWRLQRPSISGFLP